MRPPLALRPIPLSVGLGALYPLGYAPLGWWPLSIACLAGLFYVLRHASPQQAWQRMFAFQSAHILLGLHWLPLSFYVDSGGSIWPLMYAGIPTLLALSALLAGLYAVLTWLSFRLTTRTPVRLGLVTLSCLGVEWLRTLPPLTFPWQPIAAIFSENLPLLQLASFGGVFGLSSFGLMLALLLSGGKRSTWLALLLLLGAYGWGQYRLATAPDPAQMPTLITLRIVQPNIPTIWHWHRTGHPELLERHLAPSFTSNPNVSAIIWPETALPEPIHFAADLRTGLTRFLAPSQTLVLGYLDFTRSPENTWQAHNTMGTLTATGEVLAVYHKRILVPFGESIPFPNLLAHILKPLALSRGSYVRGETPVALTLTDALGARITALPLICYEAIFSRFVQQHLTPQHALLLNITNDSWFDGSVGPYQHAALARLRAVETGLSFVRVSNTGLSIVWDGYGRNVGQLPTMMPHQQGVGLTVAVPAKI